MVELRPEYTEIAERNYKEMLAAGVTPDRLAFHELVGTIRRYNALTWGAYVRIAAAYESIERPTMTDRSEMLWVSRALARYAVPQGARRAG